MRQSLVVKIVELLVVSLAMGTAAVVVYQNRQLVGFGRPVPTPAQRHMAQRGNPQAQSKDPRLVRVVRAERRSLESNIRVALLDFTTDNNSYYSGQAAGALAEVVQLGLAHMDGVEWVDRQALRPARQELELNALAGRGNLRAGRWAKADLAVRGQVLKTGTPDQTLRLQVIDLQCAELLVERKIVLDAAMGAEHDVEEGELSAIRDVIQQMLTEAVAVVRGKADARIVGALLLRNIGPTDRFDILEEQILDAFAELAKRETDVRFVRFLGADSASEEMDLALLGLTEQTQEGWQSIADVYLWGTIEEVAIPVGATVAVEERQVTVTLSAWDLLNEPVELKDTIAVADLSRTCQQMAGQLWRLAATKNEAMVSLTARDEVVETLLRRHNAMDGNARQVSNADGRNSQEARYRYALRAREMACFLDPLSLEARRSLLQTFSAPRPGAKTLSTWLRQVDLARRNLQLFAGESDPAVAISNYLAPMRQTIEMLQNRGDRAGVPADLPLSVRQAWEADLLAELAGPQPWLEWISDEGAETIAYGAHDIILCALESWADPSLRVAVIDQWWRYAAARYGRLFADAGKSSNPRHRGLEYRLVDLYRRVQRPQAATAMIDAAKVEAEKAALASKQIEVEKAARQARAAFEKKIAQARETARTTKLADLSLGVQDASSFDVHAARQGAVCRPLPEEWHLPMLNPPARSINVEKVFRTHYEEQMFMQHMPQIVGLWSAGECIWVSMALPQEMSPESSAGRLLGFEPATNSWVDFGKEFAGHPPVSGLVELDGRVWAIVPGEGIWQLDPRTRQVVRFGTAEGLNSANTQDLQEAGGRLIVASAGETLSVFDPQQLRFFDLQVVLAKEGASLNERLRRPSGDGPLAATGEYVMFGAHRTGLLHLSSSHVQSVLPMLDEKLGPSPNTEIGSDGIKLPWRINDYVADRGVFWMATPDRVIWYDPQNDACGQLPFPVTRGAVVIAADGDRVWAACSEERHPGLRGVGAQTVVMLGDRTESRWLGGFTLAGAVRAMAVTSNRVWFGRDGCENKLVEVDKRACYQLAGAQNADDKARFARPSVLAMQTGSTAVMQAAYLGDGEALEKLLMDGKQNERAAGQWSPLLSAVRSGDHAVVHRLLQQSDMARARTAPLEIAAEMGWVDLLEFLVQTGGGGMKLSTALAKAVEQGHAQAADFLLKQGASGAKDAIGENLTHRHGYGNREEHSESALVAAIEASDVDSVKVLLRHGMDPNQPGWSKLRRTAPPLRIAVGVGSLPIAQALLQAGADPNAVVDARYSLLSIAAAYGSAEVVKLLMERGARPQGSGSAADDPLTMACFHGRLQVVELLLDAGLDMYHETAWERPTYIHEPIGRKQHSLITTVTPFAAAAMGGWGEVMQLLIDRGLDVNRQTRQGVRQGDLALIRSRQEMLPVLIEMGFDINARDESGRTALIWAVQTQRTDDAQRLLAFGADPTVPNALGQTPVQLTPSAALHALLTQAVQERSGSTGTDRAWVSQQDMGLALRALADAAERGDAEAVEAMLKHHVWPNSQSSDERSALHLAAYEGHLPVVDQLIAAGAAVDMKGPEGWTALMHAAGQGHADVVRCLLNAGAEPLVLNNIGQSAHDIAIQRLHRAAAAELENAGAVVRDGRALIAAACKGQVWKLDWLLKEGANPNAVDERGWTALFYAANGENPPWLGNVSFERNYDVIKLLLACGADVNWRDKNGWTSLMALLGTHFSEGVKLADVQLLLEAGASVNIRDVYGLTPVLFVETSWWMDGELKRSIVAMLEQAEEVQ